MSMLSADERLANAIWRVVQNPARIYTKGQIQRSLSADGIVRSQSTLFGSTTVRRLLERKAEAKGLAYIIDKGCAFVTTSEWEILHKTVTQLRYHATHGESIGHDGRGINLLLTSADPISRMAARLAIMAGVNGHMMRTELEAAESVLATTFEAGRAAANTAFAAARARASARGV